MLAEKSTGWRQQGIITPSFYITFYIFAFLCFLKKDFAIKLHFSFIIDCSAETKNTFTPELKEVTTVAKVLTFKSERFYHFYFILKDSVNFASF